MRRTPWISALASFAAIALVSTADRATALDDGSLSFKNPEVQLGDRLFFETRFSQFYHAAADGEPNVVLSKGDPIMEKVAVAVGEDLPGPFAGQGMNCRQCHLGSDFLPEHLRAGRTYGDFSRRSPIPAREDGRKATQRNSPIMIDLGYPREVPVLLHLDGEFVTHEDLVIDTMTGRNFGWLPGEAALARKHIVRVIREDKGLNPRHVKDAKGNGIPYAVALAGTDPLLGDHRIPEEYRIDVRTASDDEILMAVARLMHAYMDSLRFGTNNTLRHSGSPYDLFLKKNNLPTEPAKGESQAEYSRRLLGLIEERTDFRWVGPRDDYFLLHEQIFRFGPAELAGLRIFFAENGRPGVDGHVGNCVACHPAPRFTNFDLRNNGSSQFEYDALHGAGAFAALKIPGLEERNERADDFLPITAKHPGASERFRAIPALERPGHTDLGVWNVYANPDFPKPQATLTKMLCAPGRPAAGDCRPEAVLPHTIGVFKTPSVRDLGQSEPYLHSGSLDTIESVLAFYVGSSKLAQAGKLRNASPEMSGIRIEERDISPIATFLRSLNEDYH
jgi:cytochrome c peroxidase